MITLSNGIKLHPPTIDQLDLVLFPVERIPGYGTPCRFCQYEDQVVQVQAYGTGWNGEKTFVECCPPCIPLALDNSGTDFAQPVTLEYEAEKRFPE